MLSNTSLRIAVPLATAILLAAGPSLGQKS